MLKTVFSEFTQMLLTHVTLSLNTPPSFPLSPICFNKPVNT